MNDQFGNLNTEIVTAKDEGNIRKLWRNFDDRRVPENFERVQFVINLEMEFSFFFRFIFYYINAFNLYLLGT